MLKRTALAQRVLPKYTRGEEIMNMVTHIVGGGFAIIALLLSLSKAFYVENYSALTGLLIYGVCMICIYTFSSIYHGLYPGTAKKVWQVLDHCTIYFMISGTYTPILITAIIPEFPVIGWSLLIGQWSLCAIATTLTAIDLKQFRVFSMLCYVVMGWSIIFFAPQTLAAIGTESFGYLLAGGIVYTLGAILFAIRRPWMHSVFHIFVVAGSILQFISIYGYLI